MLNDENEKAEVCGLLKLPLLSVGVINQDRKLRGCLHIGVSKLILLCAFPYTAENMMQKGTEFSERCCNQCDVCHGCQSVF